LGGDALTVVALGANLLSQNCGDRLAVLFGHRLISRRRVFRSRGERLRLKLLDLRLHLILRHR
jgi:hypothetical protein